jgi:hypothetical protein
MLIVFAALGVPTGVVIGAVVGAHLSRRAHVHAPGAFICRARRNPSSGKPGRWTKGTASARWVHDVVIVNSGMALVHYDVFPVREVQGPSRRVHDVKLRGVRDTISFSLSLDDGSSVDLVVPEDAELLAPGPFRVVDVRDAPVPRVPETR